MKKTLIFLAVLLFIGLVSGSEAFRVRPMQMNFTSGEISPRLFGRSDLAKYWNSVETLENFMILPYGGVERRAGMHYVTAQKTESRKARLIPFVFSTEQAYIIEAGHEYMRFYMNHGQILEAADSDTVLLLHMDGLDGIQTFTDSSTSVHTVTAAGTAQIDTDQSKWGGASGLFDSTTSSYLTVADHADFNWSADDIFTVEVNLRQTSLGTHKVVSQGTDADNLWWLVVWADGHVLFGVEHTSLWQLLETDAGVLTADNWHHIRAVGDGTNYYLFVDGELLVEEAITKSMQDFTGDLQIGRGSTTPYDYFDGWMDELRISDAARSVADFAPPTLPFPLTTDPYEIVTPYLESDLPLLKYFQSFDTMYIFHPDHAWRKLTRTGHAAWALTAVDFTNGPWLDEATDVNFQSDKKTAGDTGATITADGAWFTAPYTAASPHIDSILRLYISGSWGHVRITAVADSTHCTADVVATLGDTATNSTKYQEGEWSGVRGWPSSGSFNEESLVTAANDNKPQTVWASQKGDFENFEAGTDDADAYTYTIPASNRILWLGALRELVLGTGDGTYKMTGGMDDYISPTNVRVRPGMAIGAKNLGPVAVNNSLLYWQKGGRKLRELTYDPNSLDEAYVAPDLSLLADHITTGGVTYSAWQQEPNSTLWSVRSDGEMPTMAYMRPEDIVGWARQITDGEVESVAVIPDPTDTFNEVWVTVKRMVATIESDAVLLLYMEGADESTTFTDSSDSAHTVTAEGGAQIDTDRSVSGDSSGMFDSATSSYLTVGDHADFNFSDGIFTIESQTYQTALTNSTLISAIDDVSNMFYVYLWADGHVTFLVKEANPVGQTLDTAVGVLTANNWHHVRVVGDGTNYYLFVDGELLVEEAITQSMQDLGDDLHIAVMSGIFGYFDGWLDNFKIYDAALSTYDFVVPEDGGGNLKTHRYIEYMDPDMMVDSGLTYSGAAVSSVSGLDHLEGETVDIVGDDILYSQSVVLLGSVDISPAASDIQIGLPYTSKIVTLKPIINSEAGTTAGLPRKWASCWVSVYETSGLTINDEVIDFRKFSDAELGEEIPLYTGNVKVSQLGWGDGRITVEHADPLPCTILGIFGTLEIGN